MNTNKRRWIKRGIAVGLIAMMTCVNPLRTLSPANGSQPVAKAAETKSKYVEEIRLAVDKDEAKAKQILTDAGYERVQGEL